MSMVAERVMGAAQRRRERQLRAFHRHKVLSVKMALATALHHSAQRVEVPREVEEAFVGPRAQKTFPPGMRPASLAEPQGAQERVKRHTVGQCGELAPTVQILDAPVPQSGDQLLETLKNDVVEPVIEVPKIILLDCTPLRAVPREPQMAEQLVEVPVPSVREVTIMTQFVDTAGRTWNWISTPDGRHAWCLVGTQHVQWTRLEEITASPGRYINTGQG